MMMRPKPATAASPSGAGAAPADDLAQRPMNQREVSEYIAEMTLELSRMAQAAKLPMVVVPLEFAYYEAYAAAHRVEIPEDERLYLEKLDQVSREFCSRVNTGRAPEGS